MTAQSLLCGRKTCVLTDDMLSAVSSHCTRKANQPGYRANYNARQLGARDMHFTPGWSVGWYFVPIATLWKPYQAMKEIWRASHSPSDWNNASTSSILPWWWFLWLVNSFLGQAVLRMSQSAEEIDELINANLVYQASDIVSIPLAHVTLALVKNIYKAQMSHAEVNS